MTTAEPLPTASLLLQDSIAPAELERALSQGLDVPVSALRASMESLSFELPDRHEGQPLIRGALEQVSRIGKNIHDLVEFTSSVVPIPVRCSMGEIALNSSAGLPFEFSRRLLIAMSDSNAVLATDAPILIRCLRRLIENAFEARANEVLLHGAVGRHTASFSVIDDSPEEFDVEWACQPFQTSRPNHLGLGLPLVLRDVRALGGTTHVQRGDNGQTMIEIELPIEVLP